LPPQSLIIQKYALSKIAFRDLWLHLLLTVVKVNSDYVKKYRVWSSKTDSFCIPFNRLTPNDLYISRTAPLTSKRFILYIYSTNVGTEYFKHAQYSPFFLFKMQYVS
jgi:hypothetical protein